MPASPFARVETQNVDFPALERAILKFWDDNRIFEQRRARNAGQKKWSFLDGPITANNPMGVHHAWGRTYKDAYNRYFAMTGHDLRYQNGFDCQGLWVEVEVEKELKLRSKRDIESLVPGDTDASIDTFVQACKDRVNKFARVQTEQSIRLGYWMDWDRTDADWAKSPDERKSYFTMAERNNYTIWSFLKKCHGKGLVYRGYDVMPWCGRCGVGISEQEMKEGYKLTEHKSAFVKLPIKGRPGENLLVWTTTPWTLTSNVGAAVNPELVYLKVQLKGEVYYVSKGAFKLDRMAGGAEEEGEETGKKGKRPWLDGVPHLNSIEQHFKAKAGKDGYEVVGEVKGAELVGLEYDGPFDDLPAQQHPFGFPAEVAKVVEQRGWCPPKPAMECHRVVSGGGDVTDTEGTGIVHTAPGCGQIDFQWGKDNGLPPVAPIGDDGVFVEGFGTLTGKNAADPATADAVFEQLKGKDRLFATERYVHRYPHCWRCKTELLYRLVDEWFIGMGPKQTDEGFRGDIMKVADQVTFLPESINGRARERDWLRNMGDWMISKKRYWGLALPIWVDEQDPTDFEVIGSREELQARAVEGWDDFAGHTPHRPWVDRVKIKNPRTGRLMSRIPDVGNPWLDAGIVAYSTLPADWRPADFITESFPGQFRNWFYALLAMSTMMGEGKELPFKTLLGHGLVRDQFGHEMHKSTGNSIEFVAAADAGGVTVDAKGQPLPFKAIGADVMRWLYCRSNPAANLNFGPGPADEVRAKFVLKLWNCYGFFANYAALDGFDPAVPAVPVAERPDIDRWILSDLQLLTRTARAAFERFDVMAFCLAAEEFIDAKLSNWYIRRTRDRFWSNDATLDDTGRRDKLAAYQTLHTVLKDVCRLCAPVVPFVTEVMWKNLAGTPASVHLTDYPVADDALMDTTLSQDMDAVLRIVSLGGAARNAAKQKVRQPLAELRVSPGSDADRRAVDRFPGLITDELNVKRVTLHAATEPMLKASAKLNKKTAAAKLGPKLKEAEAALDALDGAAVDAALAAGTFALAGVALERADITIGYLAPDGWFGVVDRGTQVMIDARLTPELKAEGLARDVVRLVQDARKDAGLDVADKIELHLGTDAEPLRAAIAAHRDTIAGEVQATTWADAPPAGAFTPAEPRKVDGQTLTIALRKV
ncbi:isoleucine--tRNA ligase [Urbifossiella limnaea]|uniref:isoleucine--tRNA ligase n=1 Tax=Urbifossiella limnaea TaxID=2528023 RepID=A0A517XLQ6_9BACT|nr:class I tRNA ligase family protein [Urbifossiella limnaea]QDU18396.1 Isoleucine--tRNA ligase [Urbifossiella limnaea]